MVKNIKITKNQIDVLLNENRKVRLNERTSSIIYHWASPQTAWKIIDENRFSLMSTLFKSAEADLVGASHNHLYYLSMTRNSKIGMGGYSHNDHPWVRFTLDGDMINSNFHTKAIDYWGNRTDGGFGKQMRYRNTLTVGGKTIIRKPDHNDETEDRLYSKKPIIDNAKSYIKHIDIYFPIDDIKEINERSLQYVHNIMYRAYKHCVLYKTIEDFNTQSNPIDFNEFASWANKYKLQFTNDLSYPDFDNKTLPTEFVASIVYLVNFIYGDLNSCLKTLDNYNLSKYKRQVAKYINNPISWYLQFPFGEKMLTYYDENKIKNLLHNLYEHIRLANDAQRLNRDDLSSAYQILTDFCGKHKLSNYRDITKYFVDIFNNDIKNNLQGDFQSTIELPCAYLEGDKNELVVCLNPNTCKYKDVFRNGADNLKWAFQDLDYSISIHKSKSDEKFKRYLYRFLVKGNPTVQEVIDLYDKLANLGNEIDNYYKPIITQKEFTMWYVEQLISNGEYDRERTYARSTDESTVYLYDMSEKKAIQKMWNEKKSKNIQEN